MPTRTEHSLLRQGLVGAWCPSLGLDGPLVRDRSGRGNHGSLSGVTATTSGGGTSLSFTTAASSVASFGVNIPVYGLSAYSYSGWTYAAANTERTLVSRYDSRSSGPNDYFGIVPGTATPQLQVVVGTQVSNGYWQTSDLPMTSGWNHLAAAVVLPSTIIVACNGVIVSTTKFGSTISAVSAQTAVQWRANAYTLNSGVITYNTAILDDVRIYNRALTPAEIRLLASRRGIGLSPLADRGAALPRRFSVNVGGDWRSADAYFHTGAGGWKLAQAKINVGGTWK